MEYNVFANNTAPYGSFGNSLNIFIYLVFGFWIDCNGALIGGGGVGCSKGRLKPLEGTPTWPMLKPL